MLDKDDKIGDYTLIQFLGRGQFGEVWLAEKHLRFSTKKFRHALKFLSTRTEGIDLKAAEAEVDTWIEANGHPNVMPVLDMLVFKDYVIIASEYADGGSLNGWLAQNGGKAPTSEKALEMMVGILRGIEHLHSRSVVHRDLKPDNILLQGNLPRITDFGISRIVSENTAATKAVGSPAFMSPEAFLGNKLPQTDIWSAGVILYVMLTGKFPFDGETLFGLRDSIRDNEPLPLPENFGEDLKEIVARALQKDAAKRFPSAREMRAAVERAWYKLRAKASSSIIFQNDVVEEDEEENIHTQPWEDSVETEDQKSKSVYDESPDDRKQVKTQPDIEVDKKTQSSEIEKTKDAEAIEREKRLERERELARINAGIEENRRVFEEKRRRKRLYVAGGVGGSALLLSVVALFALAIFWNKTDSGNISLANGSVSEVTKKNPANNTSKDSNPIPPAGMVYVPGGEFTMGRDDGLETEKPAHKVSVQAFFMDVYETTNEQYAEFIKATNRKPPRGWTNGKYPNGQEKFPVVGVDWNDAAEFAKWAGKRLPTEEEWEFAARGKSGFLYPWGNEWKQGNANADGASFTFTEVGTFKGASPFGIFDMVGNAFEWTSSDFKAYLNGKLPDDYAGKTNLKTMRGGSFAITKEFAAATYRIGWAAIGAPDYSSAGFRCVKDIKK